MYQLSRFGRRIRIAKATLAATFCGGAISGVALAQPLDLVVDGTFDGGIDAWISTPNVVLEQVEGRLCADVPGGTTDFFDVNVGQLGIPVVAGESYRFDFDASAAPGEHRIGFVVAGQDGPFPTFLFNTELIGSEARHATQFFTAQASAPALLFFGLGGSAEPWRFCLDNVSLQSGVRYAPDTGPRLRVNQVGYLPFGPKAATLVTDAATPVEWQLLDELGQTLLRGRSQPRGMDLTSGLAVHEIRFDEFRGAGRKLSLLADGDLSHPFEVARDVYRELRADSLQLFYIQRSGTPIDGSIAGEAYARAAGHIGVAPNRGDFAVPCQPPEISEPIYGEPWTCDYTLDVEGGWYDAGDHGKYVVNGAIATAQLLSTYERSLRAFSSEKGALGDSTLRVPEHGNLVPDILDEARWELEWMLKMQVPAGRPLAGMLHHKVHDFVWTGLPLDPAMDGNLRELHRPSTAATLDFAAAAAQGARAFSKYDRAFSARLIAAAELAWQAALGNPSLLAPVSDGSNGGGPYDDSDVSDEFYWAAAELFITTGRAEYEQSFSSSPHHTGDVFDVDGFAWDAVAALGRLDLATSKRRVRERARLRTSVLTGADALLALAREQAWGQPYAPASGIWVWGSTSQILNNLVVLGTAYDLSGRNEYRDAVLEGMDILLGRNALNISFITGYGSVFSQNQHSRMYAAQLDPALPHPPVGTIAGGPNSLIQDQMAQQLLTGCLPQFCYVDDIQSWSTNELAINWNSALVWVASFLADQGAYRGADVAEGRHRPSSRGR